MMKKHNDLLGRIEAFNEAKRGGVIIEKAAKGYSLFRAEAVNPLRSSLTCWA